MTAHRWVGSVPWRIRCRRVRSSTRRSDLFVGQARNAGHDDGAGVVGGLQQPGQELHLVAADQRGGLLEADVGVEPVRQHLFVGLPPRRVVGLLGQQQHRVALVLLDDAVQGE